MATTALKVKAIILIALLAGSEAARIKLQTSVAKKLGKADKKSGRNLPADKEWKKVNAESCSWNAFGCTGAGCRFRPLPLDGGLGNSCRLSNSKMLESTDSMEYFSDLQAAILTEKAEKFKAQCSNRVSGRGWFKVKNMVCVRRASHMLQASEFIMKQQKEMLKADKALISEDEIAKQEKSVQKAMEALTSALGEDGLYVMKFRSKLMSDPIQILKNPKGSARMMSDVMSGLTGEDASRKLEAQEMVDQMPEGKEAPLTKEDAEEIKKAINKDPLDPASAEGRESQTWHDIEGAFIGGGRDVSISGEVSEDSEDNEESLLQVKEAATRRRGSKKKGFRLGKLIAVILWILLIASIIALFLAVVGLWGTGLPVALAWAVPYSAQMATVLGVELMTILKVAGGIFWYSSIMLAMRWIWRKVLGPKKVDYGWKSSGITIHSDDEAESQADQSDYEDEGFAPSDQDMSVEE